MSNKSLLCVVVALSACAAQSEPASEAAAEPTTGAEQLAPPAPPEPAAAQAAPPAAKPAEAAPQQPDSPPFGVVALHKVKDYDAWKETFDAHEQTRRDAGFIGHGVARVVDDPSGVMVWLGGMDMDDIKAFTSSKDLKDAMKKSGVVGKPKMMFMESSDNEPGSPDAKYGMLVSHAVKDYEEWKAAFDEHAASRTEAGLTGYEVGTDPADPNKVYVWITAASVDAIKAFSSSRDLKDAMKQAGVKGKPEITIVELVEMKSYE
jgi:quinol monooxygenase YgiN